MALRNTVAIAYGGKVGATASQGEFVLVPVCSLPAGAVSDTTPAGKMLNEAGWSALAVVTARADQCK